MLNTALVSFGPVTKRKHSRRGKPSDRKNPTYANWAADVTITSARPTVAQSSAAASISDITSASRDRTLEFPDLANPITPRDWLSYRPRDTAPI